MEESETRSPLSDSPETITPSLPTLPIEIVLDIIDSIPPPRDSAPVAFPAHDPLTRTLLAFTKVCKATHLHARRYLYQHCLFIDSSRRLRQLLRTLGDLESSRDEPNRDVRPYLTSLYLSPFPGSTIDDLPIAKWTYQLLSIVRSTLTRLVIDIELRSLQPWDDHLNVRPTLREALEQLENLQEFTSTRDDLSLERFLLSPESAEPALWSTWPNLRNVALYGARVNLWMSNDNFRMPPKLTNLVLNRPPKVTNLGLRELLMARTTQKLRILVIDEATHIEHRKAMNAFNEYSVRAVDDEPPIQIVGIDLPLGLAPYNSTPKALAETYQEWVREEAIAGSLWNLGGLFLGERR